MKTNLGLTDPVEGCIISVETGGQATFCLKYFMVFEQVYRNRRLLKNKFDKRCVRKQQFWHFGSQLEPARPLGMVLADSVERSMASSKNFVFSDPFPYQATIRAVDAELYPTTKGQFEAELTQVTFDRLWMQRFHEKLPEIYESKIRSGRRVIGFLTDAVQPSLQWCGRELSPQELVMNGEDVMHHRTSGDCRFGSMSLATDDFDAAYQAVVGHEFPVDKLKRIVRPSADLISRLTNLHGLVGQMAKSTPDILELPEVSRGLEQQLVHVMVRCVTDGVFLSGTLSGDRRGAIIARFKGFLEANPDTPLYLPEICAAIGAAERTLRHVCEEHLGMGPVRYLTMRRMHLARRALLQATPLTKTVTRIATDHGFWELGRFAGAYRTLFGESPVATLQRRPDHRQRA